MCPRSIGVGNEFYYETPFMMNRNYMVEINVKIPSTHMVTLGLEHGEICLYTVVTRINVVFCLSFDMNFG